MQADEAKGGLFSLEGLRQLLLHMEWADARIWRVALSCDRDRAAERLRSLLLHLHETQRAFLHVWTNQAVTFHSESDFPGLAELLDWARPYHAEARAFLASCDEAQLAQPVVLPWSIQAADALDRKIETPTLAETIFQVTSHSTHHRAQASAVLRDLGATPETVDFIVWVWLGKPTAEWPEA
ncbi:MAG TPA: DinB family protein [Gemmatimonadaceae bacterium]|nr:DinB family protein [Gemmatimonadaceae bacterium]